MAELDAPQSGRRHEGSVPLNCVRCNDTGLIEYTGGKHITYGNSLEPAGHVVEASPENPIYVSCRCKREKKPVPVTEGKVYT
jgi:hypothetical protein